MIGHKYITKIAGVSMTVTVLICFLAMVFSRELVEAAGGVGVTLQYQSDLFAVDEIITVDIQMEEAEWEDMLAHASEKEYYSCDVVINGRKLSHVGIRPKGNTSLSAIAMDPETDRFSLKLEFDHYVEGQSCLGLDKLILNNNYADATNMKEAIVYDMYQYLGADASLYNYARVSVNGEYWGVYLALEAVEDSFLLRNYGAESGALYKPESVEGGPGGGAPAGGFEGGEPSAFGDGEPFPGAGGMGELFEDGIDASRKETFPGVGESSAGPGRMPGDRGDFSGNGGADLNYTDNTLESYSAIWEGEVTDTGKEDHRLVVTALENISQGENLETYLDVDNVLKYMAVHTFSVNLDSLSGNMAHNYYLYEHNGKLNVIPWDYNLAFGGMGMGGSASEMINDAVDTPFQGTDFFNALLEDEKYLSRYHEYLRQLTEAYVCGGKFEETYNRIREQIDTLVDMDPTAFYSGEEYDAAAEMLYQTVILRAESIQGQLDGSIPSTDMGQRADSSGLVDASDISVEIMGIFDMGGNRGPGREENSNFNRGSGSSGDFGDLQPDFVPAGMGNVTADFGRRNGEGIFRNLAVYGICLMIAVTGLILAKLYRRKR